jgi:ABC-type dipeptide/oligopeptide/nickel transport system permease component
MGSISYTVRRLVLIIPTLLGASGLMFVLTILIPGDPALVRLGNFATAEQLQSLREEMGLTKPPYTRYALYLSGLLRGDMGRSWRTGNLVLDDLRVRLPVSLELGVCSMLLAIAVGMPVGVWGAANKDALVDYGGKVYGILGVAMPLFWGGLVLVYVFYFKLGIAPPPTGRIDMLVTPAYAHHRVLRPRQSAHGRHGGVGVERRPSRAPRDHPGVCHRRLDCAHDVYVDAPSPDVAIHSGGACLWPLAPSDCV